MITGTFEATGISAPIYIARTRPLGVSISGTFNATVLLRRNLGINSGRYPQIDDDEWQTEQTKTDEAEITIEISPGAWYDLECSIFATGKVVYTLR